MITRKVLMKIGTRGEWIAVLIIVLFAALYSLSAIQNYYAREAALNAAATFAPRYGMSEEAFKELARTSEDGIPTTEEEIREFVKGINES